MGLGMEKRKQFFILAVYAETKPSLALCSYPILLVHIDNQVYFMEVLGLKGYIEERAVEVANYLLNHNATVRQTAKKFGISKSTVHMDDTKWNDGEPEEIRLFFCENAVFNRCPKGKKQRVVY